MIFIIIERRREGEGGRDLMVATYLHVATHILNYFTFVSGFKKNHYFC